MYAEEERRLRERLRSAYEDVRIYVRDTTYETRSETDEETEERSEALRRELQAEFKLRAEPTDFGVGASDPAFVFAVASAVAAAFWKVLTSGKKLNESADGYIELFHKMRPFFRLDPTFNRTGAAVLATKELADRTGVDASNIRLIGYHPMDMRFMPQAEPEIIDKIEDEPERILVHTIHLLEFDVGGTRARVCVFGKVANARIGKEDHPILPKAPWA